MAHIGGDVLIRRPVDEVVDFVADERTEPTDNHDTVGSEKVTDGPIGVGPRFRAVIRAGRRALPMDIEYTGFRPASPDPLHWHVHRGLQRHADVHADPL